MVKSWAGDNFSFRSPWGYIGFLFYFDISVFSLSKSICIIRAGYIYSRGYAYSQLQSKCQPDIYICICILGSTIYDPETSSFSSIGTTTCSHQGSGCALFYSPRHKNRPTVFIGGSNDTTFDVCAEVLDYTVNTSTWEKRMYSSYQIFYFSEN